MFKYALSWLFYFNVSKMNFLKIKKETLKDFGQNDMALSGLAYLIEGKKADEIFFERGELFDWVYLK